MKHFYLTVLATLFMSVTLTAQVKQVTDINKAGDSGIGQPYFWNGVLYFEADAGDSIIVGNDTVPVGDELYVFDGDSAYMLAHINQDPEDSSPTSDPAKFIEYNGKLYFNANGGDNTGSDKELYVTDGTTEGTKLVYDFDTRPKKGGNPQEMFILNDTLYIQVNDGSSTQLWKYDGTADPVKIANDINAVYFTPSKAVVDNNKAWLKGTGSNNKAQLILFSADTYTELTSNATKHAYAGGGIAFNDGFLCAITNDSNDKELWFSNGTAEGTALVKDLDTEGTSKPEQFAVMANKAYFVAKVGGTEQLFVTDGTTDGTVVAFTPAETSGIDNLFLFMDKLFFTTSATADELWMFDGTNASKIAEIGSSPKGFIEVAGVLCFISGGKLWYTEGYADATMEAPADIDYEKANNEYATDGSKLYFTADDVNGHDDIYMFDVAAIARKHIALKDIKSLHAFNGEIFFEAEDKNSTIGDELYKMQADGSIKLVADINNDPDDSTPNSDPKNFIEYNGKLYFNGNGGDYTGSDNELYVTDGTTEGTKLVYDFDTRPKKGGNPQQMFVFKNALHLQANDGSSTQIWKYDGVNDPVKITNGRGGAFFNPFFPTVDKDKVWFKAIQANNKYQLFTFDGENTVELTNNTATMAYFDGGVLFKGGFLFAGRDNDKDEELWFSDGTPEGTARIIDLDTEDKSSPDQLLVMDNKVYFIATVGGLSQIWSTDGTEAGTVLAYKPEGTEDAGIDNLNTISGKVLFTAKDADGVALFALTDGGAEKVAAVDASPEDFYAHDGRLFFVSGGALWYTQGSTDYTKAVAADVFEGGVAAEKVDGGEFVSVGSKLSFVAEKDGGDVIVTIDAADIARDPNNINDQFETIATNALYPVPSTGVLYLNAAETFNSYKVYDLSMKLVAASTVNNNQISLDLPQGMYIVQLQGGKSSVTQKIIIR